MWTAVRDYVLRLGPPFVVAVIAIRIMGYGLGDGLEAIAVFALLCAALGVAWLAVLRRLSR